MRHSALYAWCVSKGLLGYRLLLIRKSGQKNDDAVATVDGLKKYTVGQGLQWEDVKVFRHNGFSVQPISTTKNCCCCFPMHGSTSSRVDIVCCGDRQFSVCKASFDQSSAFHHPGLATFGIRALVLKSLFENYPFYVITSINSGMLFSTLCELMQYDSVSEKLSESLDHNRTS